jgi:hypothetical protein
MLKVVERKSRKSYSLTVLQLIKIGNHVKGETTLYSLMAKLPIYIDLYNRDCHHRRDVARRVSTAPSIRIENGEKHTALLILTSYT